MPDSSAEINELRGFLALLNKFSRGGSIARSKACCAIDFALRSAKRLYGTNDTYARHITGLKKLYRRAANDSTSAGDSAGRHLRELERVLNMMAPVIRGRTGQEARELESMAKAYATLDKLRKDRTVPHAEGNFALVFGLKWGRCLYGDRSSTARKIKALHTKYYRLPPLPVSKQEQAGRCLLQLGGPLRKMDPDIRRRVDRIQTIEKECFVIMPFSKTRGRHTGSYWTRFFENFITPALAECGYKARRSTATPESIIKGIVHDLAGVDLVLAVLTDANPNVWYELGARHCLRQGTIMAIQKNQTIPFDVMGHGVIQYRQTEPHEFIRQLKTYVRRAAQGTKDNPVSEFLEVGFAYRINLAAGKLRQTVDAINELRKQKYDRKAICRHVVARQRSWQPGVQVSIVDQNKDIICHVKKKLIGAEAKNRWKDAGADGTSLYPVMAGGRSGSRIVQRSRRPNTITAIAHHTIRDWRWLVVVEAHYVQ